VWTLPLLLACAAGPTSTGGAAGGALEPAAPRLVLPGLADVACAGSTCRALVDGALVALPEGTPVGSPGALMGADTLRASGDGWEVEGPCDAGRCTRALDADGNPGAPAPVATVAVALEETPLPLAEAGAAFVAAWNAGLARGWRSGFFRVIVGPGEGRITWLRGLEGAGQLVRAGAGSRTVRLGAASSAASYPAWLAVHPTGMEAYLVAWPAPVVRAFDPATLDVRWTLPVEGAAQGLFVDPGGRWLVVGTGTGTTERFADWPNPRPDPDATLDPTRDEALRTAERPPMEAVLVIDLATRAVIGRAAGTFRRFLALDRPVLATDREILFLDPGEIPS